MSTLLAPQRRDPHQPTQGIADTLRLSSRTTRTSLLDRAALHVGLRLLIWSTRAPRLSTDAELHARRLELEQFRQEREQAFVQARLLNPRL
jgi:hypothetical protein